MYRGSIKMARRKTKSERLRDKLSKREARFQKRSICAITILESREVGSHSHHLVPPSVHVGSPSHILNNFTKGMPYSSVFAISSTTKSYC